MIGLGDSMAKLPVAKRLIKEDFEAQFQPLIDKIAIIVNPAIEGIVNALNKNISFEDNITIQVKDMDVAVNSNGIPISAISFNSELKTKLKGIICIRADNLSNSSSYPSGGVFLSFSEDGKTIKVSHITGLTASDKYRLKLLIL